MNRDLFRRKLKSLEAALVRLEEAQELIKETAELERREGDEGYAEGVYDELSLALEGLMDEVLEETDVVSALLA